MSTKPTLKYKVVNLKNPLTGGDKLRPLIVDREKYDLDQVVDFAKTAGFIRGQIEDLKGNANGLFEAIKKITKMGKQVDLASWIRIKAMLTGTVGETRQLTSANDLRVAVTSLADLKLGVDEFNWTNAEDSGVIPNITSITSCGGENGIVRRSQQIVVNGKNLMFNAEYGDSVTVTWGEGENAHTASLTPTSSGRLNMFFAWTDDLAAASVGAKLTFVFRTCAGIQGGAVYTLTREVTVEA